MSPLAEARRAMVTVSLKLPHAELVVNGKASKEYPESARLLFMPDMGLWFADHQLDRAPDPVDLYGDAASPYHFATELRVHNIRGRGTVGGWISEPTHVKFFFKDKKTAMLFKLTWGGS